MDPEWLLRKKYGAPTSEDLSVLKIPDPIVNLKLNHFPVHTAVRANVSASGASENGKEMDKKINKRNNYNRKYGLHVGINEENLLPQFSMELNIHETFANNINSRANENYLNLNNLHRSRVVSSVRHHYL